MTALLLIRHGPTAWNAAGRVQGQTDVPLSAAGRARVRRWRLPDAFAGFVRIASPLVRASETARLLGARPLPTEPRLMEMHWGEWEGATLAGLRARYGEEMIRNEGRGLDFRAQGGETPREVQARLLSWTAEVAARGDPVAAVTHRGVIRALMAQATGWDMLGKPPHKIGDGCAHLFRLDSTGRPTLDRMNIPLEEPWRDGGGY
ncbi:MAG: histidine phosphatase family protein [Rhodospirillaceae bacterium]|jgi:broad specificity phosphatase PhoE|nr:histidine phosphatase family protein [Rhodospirillaceae bacterium]MBT6118226.1 histidine phosphatase family protein [Rhodospirillaceae bacterium]